MNEQETKQEVAESVETTTETPATPAKKKSIKGYVAAVLVVGLIILGVLYLLEKEGRSSTAIFTDLIEQQQANVVVAVVNDEKILAKDLDLSITQFSQAAAAQGVDVTTTEAQAEIRKQALEVLTNTTLLRQVAAEQGLEITDEQVEERLEAIRAELGGAEVLAERMGELGIDEEKLFVDVRDELLIQDLLDTIFAETEIVVSEEEVTEVYENAGGADAGLPPLEEVREQIVAQITATKEQSVIEEYLAEIKETAVIDITE